MGRCENCVQPLIPSDRSVLMSNFALMTFNIFNERKKKGREKRGKKMKWHLFDKYSNSFELDQIQSLYIEISTYQL